MKFDDLSWFQQWAVCVLIGENKNFPHKKPFGIEIKINGHEVDPLELLDTLEEAYIDRAKSDATTILQNKLFGIEETLSEFHYELENFRKDFINRLESKLNKE